MMSDVGAPSSKVVVEMFPASYGDAFLIRCISPAASAANILVDAGPLNSYRQWVKPRLQALAKDGESLDAMVITHIDADHIEGAIALLEENGPATSPAIIGIRDVWHNSYR